MDLNIMTVEIKDCQDEHKEKEKALFQSIVTPLFITDKLGFKKQ